MEVLSESLPSYSDKDLVVCHRKNERGVYKDELWTKRAFGANELIFAPLVSQIKDSHLTLAANAALGIPKNGRGAHPDNQALCLDGRGKSCIAAKGSIDDDEHKGILYWLAQRTSEQKEANTTIENITWEQQLSLQMPYKKKSVRGMDLL